MLISYQTFSIWIRRVKGLHISITEIRSRVSEITIRAGSAELAGNEKSRIPKEPIDA